MLEVRHLQCWGCSSRSAGPAGFAVPFPNRFPALRDLQCWKSASFQRFPAARPWIRRFHYGRRHGVHGPAHGRGILFRRVRLPDPREGRRVGFDREVPHDLAVLWQTVPAALAEARITLVAAADEPPLLESLQRGAHGAFAQFGDVDDGRDLRIGCGAVVVRAVRQVDEHGLRAGIAHMASEGP